MKNRLKEQFKGFLNTFPLWEGSGPFGIIQFTLPPAPEPFPQEIELQMEIPSLSQNFVLGKRMESYFSFLIGRSSRYHMIAENIQITQDKITIGEIDFIAEDKKEDGNLHVELVYKFYVYDPSFEREVDRWIGPNRRDSLLRKINKLKEHQFPLFSREETRDMLESLKIDIKKLKQQVCFKANLFIPREMSEKTFPLINNSCICGFWIRAGEFNSYEYSESKFFIPNKTDWPVNPETNKEWYSFDLIYEQVIDLHARNFSPLLWRKSPTGKVERLFVVYW